MQKRRNPGVVCLLASSALIWLGSGAGCATAPGSYAGSPVTAPLGRVTFLIVETVPAGGTIWVNEEERGVSPVHLRVALNQQGVTATDLEIRVEWADGRSDSTYILPRGSLPQSNIRINTNGMLVQ